MTAHDWQQMLVWLATGIKIDDKWAASWHPCPFMHCDLAGKPHKHARWAEEHVVRTIVLREDGWYLLPA